MCRTPAGKLRRSAIFVERTAYEISSELRRSGIERPLRAMPLLTELPKRHTVTTRVEIGEDLNERQSSYPPNCTLLSVSRMVFKVGHSTSFISLKALR